MPALPLALSACVLLASWWLTGRVRQYALERRVLDIPNARSSHSIATPRGGGMAIVVTTCLALAAAGSLDLLPWRHVWGMLGGGTLVAIIGFADDHRPRARRWRLLGHFVAAGVVVACFRGLPPLPAFGTEIDPGWLGYPVAALYVAWLVNLTNFMDGIDGLAAIEVITVALGGILVYVLAGRETGAWVTPLLLASATFGFLLWNWAPAKIFMGDAGSGFVGLMLAALSLQAAWAVPTLFWSWLILLGVFIVDATLTLCRRAIRGERFYEPHRTHAYQHAAQRRAAHKPVTVAVALINLCWLIPIAVLVALHQLDGLTGILVAYTPLTVVALWLGAGTPETTPFESATRHI